MSDLKDDKKQEQVELQSLNIDDLDIVQLERRLELSGITSMYDQQLPNDDGGGGGGGGCNVNCTANDGCYIDFSMQDGSM